ncbi:hypothetical protein GUITHDRAFT_101881 [Guillardia theta CCMP2712]|uniref:HEAT repeat domain-containing protein n=1 Tax=Guillardia theta (strain CCMP2712) TaxID=905079 RepID=L1JWM1_GUITC|nr:hypothetical protein GUITHDRAFT_101881 [Guillardia theta CCMP2712]EKX52729.1 hypothetical protein GUITHDRAFT_101881 [Guillardia theta CCMP2712]|eukprot:XP_005839709.1 hypothetical protein GUITHDRAFT_101881 [Guillardia theta CCMP2712]
MAIGNASASGVVRRVERCSVGLEEENIFCVSMKRCTYVFSPTAMISWIAKTSVRRSSGRIAFSRMPCRTMHANAEASTNSAVGLQERSNEARKGVLVLWDLYSKPPTHGDVSVCVERLRRVAASLGNLKSIKVFGRPAKEGGALGTGSITPYFSAQLRHGRRTVHPNLHKDNDKVAHWTGDRWVILPVLEQLNAIPSAVIEQGEKGEALHLSHEDVVGEEERWCKVCETLVCVPCWPGCTRLASKLREVQTERSRWQISRIRHRQDIHEWFKNKHDFFHKRKTKSFRPKYFVDTVERLNSLGVEYVEIDWKEKETADGLLKKYLAWSIHTVLGDAEPQQNDPALTKWLSTLSDDVQVLSDVETIVVVTDGNHRERSFLKRWNELEVPEADSHEKLQEIRMDAARLRREIRHTRQKKQRNLYLKEAELLECTALGIQWAASYVEASSSSGKKLRLIVISDDSVVRGISDSPVSWSWLCNAPDELFAASLTEGVMEPSRWQEGFKRLVSPPSQLGDSRDPQASIGSVNGLPSFWEHLGDLEWVIYTALSCPDDSRHTLLDLCLRRLEEYGKSGDQWRLRVNLIECVALLGASAPSPRVFGVLSQLLKEDKEPFVRRACVEAMSAIGLHKLEGSVDVVCHALHADPSDTVRWACARCLQSIELRVHEIVKDMRKKEKDNSNEGLLQAKLSDQDMRVRNKARECLKYSWIAILKHRTSWKSNEDGEIEMCDLEPGSFQ